MIVLAMCLLFPLYWTINLSLLPEVETITYPPHYYPPLDQITLNHYVQLFTKYPILQAQLNTVVIVILASFITLLLSLPLAYTLTKHDFKLRKPFYIFMLMLLPVPWVAYVLPIYRVAVPLGLIDTPFLMIMLYGFSGIPLFTWMAMPLFRAFPNDIIEAGRVYGCSEFGILWKIVVPILRNACVALFLIRFIWAYNDLLYQLTFTIYKTKMIIPTVLEIPGYWVVPIGNMAAGGVITVAPIILMAIAFRKYVVSGLSAGIRAG